MLPPPVAQQLIAAFATMRDRQALCPIRIFPCCCMGSHLPWGGAGVAPSGVDEVLVMVRDVTKRKHAEEALSRRTTCWSSVSWSARWRLRKSEICCAP